MRPASDTRDGVWPEQSRLVVARNRASGELNMWTDEKSRKDKSGKRWNFCYWYSGQTSPQRASARLFFWDDGKIDCGVVLFLPGSTIRYSRIKDVINKLVADPANREKHKRQLNFPLERHYSEYPIFPEENSN
jgi:hypothetical protein